MHALTPEHVQTTRQAINALPDDVSRREIEQTAERLKRDSYEPLLIRKPPNFLYITKERLLAFIDELAAISDEEEVTQEDLNLLVHQYRFLQRLRRDEPEAWDEISELWEED